MEEKLVYKLGEIGKEDNMMVGRKCANLGELTKIGMPVPMGFAISVAAQKAFFEETGLLKKIDALLPSADDLKKNLELQTETAKKIRELISETPMPAKLADIIGSYYNELTSALGYEPMVAVRSAGVESRPGTYETFLNVKGINDVMEMVKKVWSSVFNPRAIAYQVRDNLPVTDSPCIGVAVIEMINATCAGVLFTAEPVTGDPDTSVIEANFGLGESVVSGAVVCDVYKIDRKTMSVKEKILGEKGMQITTRDTKGGITKIVTDEASDRLKNTFTLLDDEACEIARLGYLLEDHFGAPQDIEWAVDQDRPFPKNIFLLQARDIKGVKIERPKTEVEKAIDDLMKSVF